MNVIWMRWLYKAKPSGVRDWRDLQKAVLKGRKKEEPKEEPKEGLKEELKGELKEEPKEEPKEGLKDEPRVLRKLLVI